MLMIAVTILFTMKVMGMLLISAMLVTPAATARMVTNSFSRMLAIAPMIGVSCGFADMLLSYHIDVSPGATIILMASTVFLVVFTVTGSRGRRNIGGLAYHEVSRRQVPRSIRRPLSGRR